MSNDNLTPINVTPIGLIHTPFMQKFGIPRQSGIAESALGKIEMTKEFSDLNAFRGIEKFSHIWLLFHFHKHSHKSWSPLIRPPRLGGNEKVGVFASRSTFRPNHLGQSVVKLKKIEQIKGSVWLTVAGVDLLDQTPIVDIKPYIPYADSIPEASASYASTPPRVNKKTELSKNALKQIESIRVQYPEMLNLICQLLSQDPRPAYKKSDDTRKYIMQIYEFDVQWEYRDGVNYVNCVNQIL